MILPFYDSNFFIIVTIFAHKGLLFMLYRKKLYDAISKIVCDCKSGSLAYDAMIKALVRRLQEVKRQKAFCYFIGNGGSAGIAIHMTADFLKNGHVKTHSMHDPAMLTCLANDYGYEYVFGKQLELVAESEDVLFAISSSGNSPNIINAVDVAIQKGCYIVTLSGFRPNNRLRVMGNVNIYVPSEEYGIVETIHNMVLQQLVDELAQN